MMETKANKLSLLINGNTFICNVKVLSLNHLKDYLFLSSSLFIVEHNLKIKDGNDLESIEITNLDKMEFITTVGGG